MRSRPHAHARWAEQKGTTMANEPSPEQDKLNNDREDVEGHRVWALPTDRDEEDVQGHTRAWAVPTDESEEDVECHGQQW